MTRVLLLTPWYFPIKILRWEDAVKMKYEGTIDVIVEYDEEVSSPSITWKMPAVIRLRKLEGKVKRGVKFSRINVYTRDGFRCQYCYKKFLTRQLTYDHVVPRASGGRTTWENIVTCCKPCNAEKDSKTCDEAGMWPSTSPVRPKTLPMTSPVINLETIPEEWEGFCAGV
jgi:5-methylcytosine-specific restriction endonuclease McrA